MDKLISFRKNKKHSSCNVIIIDDFYENPLEVRNFALQQNFSVDSYYPGKRTKNFATIELKNRIQQIVESTMGKITYFPLNSHDNGTFQIATSNDRSWVHTDNSVSNINMAGVLYLTPDAPVSSGTTIFRLKHHNIYNEEEHKILNINMKNCCRDYSKWEAVDTIGNVFNRLVLFNSRQFHCSTDYFGSDINDGRLFQVFFFATEF
jgi:hypothetical protein